MGFGQFVDPRGRRAELTRDKGYREEAIGGEPEDTLTQVRGYRSPEHEFVCQAGVPRANPRPPSAGRPDPQDSYPRRVLCNLRVPPQGRPAAIAPATTHSRRPGAAWSEAILRTRRAAARAQGASPSTRSSIWKCRRHQELKAWSDRVHGPWTAVVLHRFRRPAEHVLKSLGALRREPGTGHLSLLGADSGSPSPKTPQ